MSELLDIMAKMKPSGENEGVSRSEENLLEEKQSSAFSNDWAMKSWKGIICDEYKVYNDFVTSASELELHKVLRMNVDKDVLERVLKERTLPKPEYEKSKQLTAEELVQVLGCRAEDDVHEKCVEEQAKKVASFKFQQAINCCQITAVSYAFTCLGYPTTVDDIFLRVGVDVESAVGDGMTLAETHELAVRYSSIMKFPIFVDCYHFDEQASSVKGFESALIADGDGGLNDIIALNFHSGIAHGMEHGGGHFSVLAGYSQEDKRVIVADVHPMKYGAFWSTPLWQMLAAMNDWDSIGRSRGFLHFGNLKSVVKRPLPGLARACSLIDWTSPENHSGDVLRKYIPVRWGTFGCRNMEGVSALALALRALEGPKCKVPYLDDIMRALKESYTEHLNTFLSASKIVSIAQKLKELGIISVLASLLKIEGVITGSVLKEALKEVECGKDGIAVMVSFKMNQAQGLDLVKEDLSEAGALCHGAKSWAVLASLDVNTKVDDRRGLVVASATYTQRYGKLWTCSLENLAKGMTALESKSLVLLRLPRSYKLKTCMVFGEM